MMEHSAFESLFLRYHDGIFRLMYQLVGEEQEAEDLVQETFLRLYHHHGTIQQHKIKPWLHQVAMNLGRNVLRKRKSVAFGQQKLQTSSSTSEKSDLTEATHIRATLQQMPEKQVELLLYYMVGLSREEIAEILDVSPASIGKLLGRAKQSFQITYGKIS